jgi:cytochrome P450
MTSQLADLYYDSNDPDVARDPGAVFRRLREEAPLYYNDKLDLYALSRYDDVVAGLLDNVTYISRRGATPEFIKSGVEIPPGTVLFEDPPSHAIHRALLSRAFTPKKMAALEPQVREFCVETLDPLVGAGRFDFVADIAIQIPMLVIGMLLGVPRDQRQRIRDYFAGQLDQEGHGFQEEGEKTTHMLFGTELFSDYIDWRAEHPSDDVVTELLSAEFEAEDGVRQTLTREEILMYVNILAVGGNDTTARLIGICAQLFAEHPDQRRLLTEDFSLIPNAIEEVMRFQPPDIQTCRYVDKDVELYGQVVPEGSVMALVTASANRDERIYDDPDRFDVLRKGKQHLSFGFGPHYCLGAHLSRLETRVLFEEALTRFPDWEVDTDKAVFTNNEVLRGWSTLPVVTA